MERCKGGIEIQNFIKLILLKIPVSEHLQGF